MNGWVGLTILLLIVGVGIWFGKRNKTTVPRRNGEFKTCPGCGAGLDDYHDIDCPRRPW